MISVCIATYNGEKYIKCQLESILKQLATDDEIIVSDDESTDNTISIINNLNDNRIKVYNHKKDKSLLGKTAASFMLASDNFENAINHSKGDYIFLSDQDDIWVEGRVEKMLSLLKTNGMVMCNFSTIDGNDNIITKNVRPNNPVSNSLLCNMLKTPFLGCCMAFQRETLLKTLPFPKPCIGHDFWIGCLLMKIGTTYSYIDTPLHHYRVHGHNVSPTIGKSKNNILFKISYRIKFLSQIKKHLKN